MTRADGASAAAVQAKVLKALGRVGEGAEIIVEPEIPKPRRPGDHRRSNQGGAEAARLASWLGCGAYTRSDDQHDW